MPEKSMLTPSEKDLNWLKSVKLQALEGAELINLLVFLQRNLKVTEIYSNRRHENELAHQPRHGNA